MSGKPIPAEKMPRVIGTTFPTPLPPIADDPPYGSDLGKGMREVVNSYNLARQKELAAADDPLGLYRKETRSSEALRPDGIIEYDPATVTRAETHAEAIRSRLRLLTHRAMREFAADLFAAYERLHPQTEPTVIKAAIPREALAEVLDRFAHND